MKKWTIRIMLVLILITGIAVGTITAAASALDTPQPYPMNENGQTYGGVINPYSVNPQDYPQLIAAIGIDGTEGYVYPEDLDGDQPSNPEEAVKYMEDLEQKIARAKRLNQEYLRYIPLYDCDGVTVIGEFGISY